MNLSVGQLHSAMQLLEVIKLKPADATSLTSDVSIILVCPVGDTLNLSLKCNWLAIDGEGMVQVAPRGRQLGQFESFQERLREQLKDFVVAYQPVWSKLIFQGRKEFSHSVATDICQCFDESGLLANDLTDNIVSWWDEVANLCRGFRSTAMLKTGRLGEKLSLEFEERRTTRKPIWQAIESNSAGYDVLSILEASDTRPLQIEVKATTQRIREAQLNITSNEWRQALSSMAYQFHLWAIGERYQHAVLECTDIQPHMPENREDGRWSQVQIPFRTFVDKFEYYQSSIF